MSQPTRDEIHDAWNRLILGRAFRIEYIDAGGSLHKWDQIRSLIR